MPTLDELITMNNSLFDLLIAAKGTRAHPHIAKAWQLIYQDFAKAERAAKKAEKKTPITSIEVSETVVPLNFNDQTVKVETPDIAPVPAEVTKDTTPRRGSKTV